MAAYLLPKDTAQRVSDSLPVPESLKKPSGDSGNDIQTGYPQA